MRRLDDGNKAVHKCLLCLSHLFHFLHNDVPVMRLVKRGLSSESTDANSIMGYSPGTSMIDPSLPFLDLGFLAGENSGGFLFEFDGQTGL